MNEWLNMSIEQLAQDPEARLEKRRCYFNTLMATPEGRAVLADLVKRTYIDNAGLEPTAVLAAIEQVEYIKTSCGLTNILAQIEALAGACAI